MARRSTESLSEMLCLDVEVEVDPVGDRDDEVVILGQVDPAPVRGCMRHPAINV